MSHAYNHYKKAVELELEHEDWFAIWTESMGNSTLVSSKLLNKIILIMTKTALITGANRKRTAQLLAKNNYKIILCGRREDRLDDLKKNYQNSSSLNFDVRDKKAFLIVLTHSENFATIDILINNETHGLDLIQNGNLDDWDAMIDKMSRDFYMFQSL
jgi:NAD(P)-dependent dehydrogenase (short-subunit alcohol dehydrogenase family)